MADVGKGADDDDDDDERLKNREKADVVSTSGVVCEASTTEEEEERSGVGAYAGAEETSGDSVDADEVDGCSALGGACSGGAVAEDEDWPGGDELVALSRGVVVKVRTTEAGEKAGMAWVWPLQPDG